MWEILNYEIKILPLIAGGSIAFLGWLLYWLSINITGASFGGTAGVLLGALLSLLFGKEELFYPLVAILGIVGIILGTIIIRKIHKLVFFLTGFALGALIMSPVFEILKIFLVGFFISFYIKILLKILCGIICGFLLYKFNRYVISVLTALTGSLLMMSSWDFKGGAMIGVPLFLVSFIFQVFILHGKKKILPGKISPDD
jgi:xanthosine utilization system XapX-like protein